MAGKKGTEWAKGKRCPRCSDFQRHKQADNKSGIGICSKFNITVIDCLCGCKKNEDGGITLLNFEEGVLDRVSKG